MQKTIKRKTKMVFLMIISMMIGFSMAVYTNHQITLAAQTTSPQDTPNYNTWKGWANWSQYTQYYTNRYGKFNGMCWAMSNARAAASHGVNIMPSGATTTPNGNDCYAENAVPGKYSSTRESISGVGVAARIKAAIPLIKKAQSQGNEVTVRIQDGGVGQDHTMMVDNVSNGNIYVFDPATMLSAGVWKAYGASHVKAFLWLGIIHPDTTQKRLSYSSSAVRAQLNGDGTIIPSGDGANSNASNEETSPNNSPSKNSNTSTASDASNKKTNTVLAPIFNPFQSILSPTVASNNATLGQDGAVTTNGKNAGGNNENVVAVNTAEVPTFSILELQNTAQGFLPRALRYIQYAAVILLFSLIFYMLIGLILILIDDGLGGIISNANIENKILHKFLHPNGSFMGVPPGSNNKIKSSISIAGTMMVVILLLASVITGFYTEVFAWSLSLIEKISQVL